MEPASAAAIGKVVSEYGILGLGWILFVFMMFREVRERKRYSELVIHIIQYFTKVRMVENDSTVDIPEALFQMGNVSPRRKSSTRRIVDSDGDEEERR